MSDEKKLSGQKVPIESVCAVLCNFARPTSTRACVRQLLKLGLTEVIVWNNGAEPIPEATRNIIKEKNIGPLGKHLGALETKKPYVLIQDDDCLVTKAGLDSMRRWVLHYPAVAQQGCEFRSPFDSYNSKEWFRSQNLESPREVDMIMPNKGMMLETRLYRLIPPHWAWGAVEVLSPNIFTSDLSASCAVTDLAKRPPAVVPGPAGFERLHDEAPEKALKRQKNIIREKTKVLRWLVAHGWKFLGNSKPRPITVECQNGRE
jgi:hypothetical protein